jgi:hypothetical protein
MAWYLGEAREEGVGDGLRGLAVLAQLAPGRCQTRHSGGEEVRSNTGGWERGSGCGEAARTVFAHAVDDRQTHDFGCVALVVRHVLLPPVGADNARNKKSVDVDVDADVHAGA